MGARRPDIGDSPRSDKAATGGSGTGREAQRSTEKHRRHRLFRVGVLAVLFGLVGWWAFHQGPTPQKWRAALTEALAEQWDMDVSIGAVSIAGFDRIALHDVRVGGAFPMAADRVTLAFALGEWLQNPGDPTAALRWLRIDDWTVTVPKEALPAVGDADGMRADLLAALGLWLPGAGPDADANRPGMRIPAGSGEGGGRTKQRLLWTEAPWAAWLDKLADHSGPDGTLTVYGRDGRIVLGQDGPQRHGAPAVAVDGAVVAGQGRLVVRNVRFHLDEAAHSEVDMGAQEASLGRSALTGLMTVNGTAWPDPDLYAKAAWSGPTPFGRHVRAEGEGWWTGTWDGLDGWGTLRLRDVALPWWSVVASGTDQTPTGAPYMVDDMLVHWGHRPGRPWQVVLEAQREHGRVRLEGEIAQDGRLALAVAATDVRIPEDIPPLAPYDVRGVADVFGNVNGTWSAPVLAADVSSDGGYLFGQAVSTIQGHMTLTREGFAFDNVQVTQGQADYFLDGRLIFSPTQPFEVVLTTSTGRAETLLAVIGWDVPVHAAMQGTIRFERPANVMTATGRVRLARGSAWGQPFDELQGGFRYADGGFQLTDVTGAVRGGTVKAWGGSAGLGDSGPVEGLAGAGGDWAVHVEANNIPLQAIAWWRAWMPGVSGLFNLDGTVFASAVRGEGLHGQGRVTARHVVAGPIDVTEAKGAFTWGGGALDLEDVTLWRRNGGVYELSGRIADVPEGPWLRLWLEGRDESVEALVALSDWRLPLLARSEPLRVHGTIEGPPSDLEARLRVEADAVYVVGRPAPLDVNLRWRDGRFEVEDRFLGKGNSAPAGT